MKIRTPRVPIPPKKKHETVMRGTCCACCQAIRATDKALFCTGACQKWLHHYCASITVQQYKATTDENCPFLCPCCCREQQQNEINELQNTVEALKLEICELKEPFLSLTMAQSKLREEMNAALTIVSSI